MTRLRTLLWLFATFGVVGCGFSIPQSELPTEPLAFVRQEADKGVSSLDQFLGSIEMNVGLRPEEIYARRQKAVPKTSVMLFAPTTRKVRPVLDAGFGALPFDWSSDGLFLLIGRPNRHKASFQLFSWNRLTGAYDRLTPDQTDGSAAFGPGPIRLASVGRMFTGGQPQPGLFLTTDDEGTQAIPDGLGGVEPDVMPDGLAVVYVRLSERDRDGTILLSRLGDGAVKALARGRQPKLSRDGRWIAYTRWRSGNSDVWIMRSDGSGRRPVATTSYDELNPAVSPDGRYVVYASARGERKPQLQLYVTRIRDRRETQLTQHGQNGRPVW